MKKISVFFCVFFIALANVEVRASQNGFIPGIIIEAPKESDDIKITGEMPVLDVKDADSTSLRFLEDINQKIGGIIDDKIAKAEKAKAKSVDFGYEVKQSGECVSILIYTTIVSGAVTAEVNSINYNALSFKYMSINDILGPNGVRLVNKFISAEIRKVPSRYKPNFSGIDEAHCFYMEEGSLVVLFDAYEIAAGAEGIISFTLDTGKVITFEIPYSKTVTKLNYSLKMLPLRQVCEAFGYETVWISDAETAVIKKGGGIRATLVIGRSNYIKDLGQDKSLSVELEAAPEINDGTTFVPVSFFEEILGIFYFVDSGGNVTVSDIMPD